MQRINMTWRIFRDGQISFEVLARFPPQGHFVCLGDENDCGNPNFRCRPYSEMQEDNKSSNVFAWVTDCDGTMSEVVALS